MDPKTKENIFIAVGLLISMLAIAGVIVGIIYLVKTLLKKSSKDTYSNRDYSNKTKESYDSNQSYQSEEIRENFPRTSNLNVLYTDENGNLGATSDLGISYLTVNGASKINGGTDISGGATIDKLNVTTSITSPTINTINNTLTSLQQQITNLQNNCLMKSGGTISNLTVSGNLNISDPSDSSNVFTLQTSKDNVGYQMQGQNLSINNKFNKPIVRFFQAGWGNQSTRDTESLDFFKRSQDTGPEPTDNKSYLKVANRYMTSWLSDCGGREMNWPNPGCDMKNFARFG